MFNFKPIVYIFITFPLLSTQVVGATGHDCVGALDRAHKSEKPEGLARSWDKILPYAYYGAATAAGLFFPLASLAGGFSGSGGGSGVLSFKSNTEAAMVREMIAEGKVIPSRGLKTGRLRTLERFEMDSKGTAPFSLPPEAKWQDYLAKAYQNVRMLSPILARRLEQISEWMEFGDWQHQSALGLLGDANPRHALSENEVAIQVALRLSNGNSKRQDGPTLQKVEIKILFDKRIFDLFDPLDQAILVLHEQLYALGQAAGLKSSDEIRPLVILSFSDYANNLQLRSRGGLLPVGSIPLFKEKLATQFGDYAMFFADLGKIPNTRPRTADRHFNLFVEVISELREGMRSCLGSGMAPSDCGPRVLLAYGKRDDLSDEKAFVFMSYFLLEKNLRIINSEALINDKLSEEEFVSNLDFACAELRKASLRIKDHSPGLTAAMRYCK